MLRGEREGVKVANNNSNYAREYQYMQDLRQTMKTAASSRVYQLSLSLSQHKEFSHLIKKSEYALKIIAIFFPYSIILNARTSKRVSVMRITFFPVAESTLLYRFSRTSEWKFLSIHCLLCCCYCSSFPSPQLTPTFNRNQLHFFVHDVEQTCNEIKIAAFVIKANSIVSFFFVCWTSFFSRIWNWKFYCFCAV